MTDYQSELQRAYAAYGQTVAEGELRHRGQLRAAGWSKADIDIAIARAAPLFAERRARIPAEVMEAMAREGALNEGTFQ